MDIIGNFSKSNSQGAASAAPAQGGSNSNSTAEAVPGANLIDQLGAKKSETTNAANVAKTDSEDKKVSSSKVEPTEENTVVDPDSWTKDSAFKEIKKLREEAKATRLKYQEQVENMKADSEARIAAKVKETEQLVEAKKELDRIKAEQEDKKRDLSDKVAHREAKLAEMQALMEAKEKDYQGKLSKQEALLNQFLAEKEAENQVYANRIQEEVDNIPEKYRDYANLIVKGAGDPRDALLALNEAKVKGMFDDKTVVVNHSTPGANDGARSSKERMDSIERERLSKLSSTQKIRAGLEGFIPQAYPASKK